MIPPPRASATPGASRVRVSDGGESAEGEWVATTAVSAPEAEDGPPLDALEAGMAGEVQERDAVTPAAARRAARARAEDDDARSEATLPEVDELVAKLPAELRDTMDELLRVRFVRVKRVPRKDLSVGETAKEEADASAGGEMTERSADAPGGDTDA